MQFVEVIRTVDHRRRRLRGRQGARRAARQEAGHRRRQGRLHRQRAAVRLPQPRGRRCTRASYATREDLDAAMRFGCGYPMGPLALLDLIGLDTAYEILDTMYKQGRDRLHAPSPIIKQMVSAGLLGPQERAAASTPTPSAGLARRSWPTRRRPPVAPPAGVSLRPVTVGGRRRLGHDGDRHHRGLRQGRVRRDLRRPRRRQGRRPCAPRSVAAAPARWSKGRMTAEDARRAARPGRPARPRARPWPTSTWSSRRSPRTSPVKQDALPRPRRGSASRAPSSPRPRRRCRSSTAPRSTDRPQDVVGMHFFNPAPGHEAGRGRAHRVDLAATSPPRCRTSVPRSASTPSPVATAPASSSTRCCSPT